MASPFAPNPENVPLHLLFPAEYRATCKMIVKDFALIGSFMVLGVVGLAFFF